MVISMIDTQRVAKSVIQRTNCLHLKYKRTVCRIIPQHLRKTFTTLMVVAYVLKENKQDTVYLQTCIISNRIHVEGGWDVCCQSRRKMDSSLLYNEVSNY